MQKSLSWLFVEVCMVEAANDDIYMSDAIDGDHCHNENEYDDTLLHMLTSSTSASLYHSSLGLNKNKVLNYVKWMEISSRFNASHHLIIPSPFYRLPS